MKDIRRQVLAQSGDTYASPAPTSVETQRVTGHSG
jgi:hypothetical protein